MLYTLIILKCLDCQPYVASTEEFPSLLSCMQSGMLEAAKLRKPPYRIICAEKTRVPNILGRGII